MPSPLPIDWEAVRKDYLSRMSVPELSQKYGVQQGTIRQRIRRGVWLDSRKIDQQVSQHVGSRLATIIEEQVEILRPTVELATKDAVESWVDKSIKTAGTLRCKVDHYLGLHSSPRDLASLASALDISDRVGRRSLGLDDGPSGPRGDVRLVVVSVSGDEDHAPPPDEPIDV